MENETRTTELFESHTPKLSREKKEALFARIDADIKNATPRPSPFLFSFITTRSMALALGIVLMLSMGGTVAMADSARPGDALFPVDRAVEKVRLAVTTNNEAKARLRASFGEERLLELKSIVNEEAVLHARIFATSSPHSFEAEADVFADTTIVKVEIDDITTTFETEADTRAEVVAEIVTRFGIDRGRVESSLDFEVEDRASRSEDRSARAQLSAEGEVRVEGAVSTILDYFEDEDFDAETKNEFLLKLSAELDMVDPRIEVKNHRTTAESENGTIEIREDGNNTRIEIEDGDTEIRVREKDGETRIDINDVSSGGSDDDTTIESRINTEIDLEVESDDDKKLDLGTNAGAGIGVKLR